MSKDKRRRSAHEYALDLLSQRAYTRAMLERKLATKGFASDEVTSELESLQQSGLLDDAKFAEAYARTQLTSRKKSFRRVTLELISKGIAPELAKAAIAGLIDEGSVDIDDSIQRVAEKKLGSLRGLEPQVQRRRLFMYLNRQGFDGAAIRRYMENAK